MSGTIMLIFIFGMDRAKLFFWQPKCQTFFWLPLPLLAVGTRELVAFILGSIFLAVKSVFGRILPKIQVGTISAKKKSWQTQSFFLLFARTHYHSLCNRATHTTPKTQNIQPHPTTKHVIIITAAASSVAACAPGNRRRRHFPPAEPPTMMTTTRDDRAEVPV